VAIQWPSYFFRCQVTGTRTFIHESERHRNTEESRGSVALHSTYSAWTVLELNQVASKVEETAVTPLDPPGYLLSGYLASEEYAKGLVRILAAYLKCLGKPKHEVSLRPQGDVFRREGAERGIPASEYGRVFRLIYPKVAIQGCSHGNLSTIYQTIAQYTSSTDNSVDLLLLCGDFQALRSEHDFPSLAVPPKYHSLGSFHQYYSSQKKAPILTIVIGGNHEASNYMWELYHGGWLAENIYYMGAAGSVMVNGMRIVGASGIYKDHDYGKGESSVTSLLRDW